MEIKLPLGAPLLAAAILCGGRAAVAQQENQAAPAIPDPSRRGAPMAPGAHGHDSRRPII